MPSEGFANPIMSDWTRFCSNTPVSELIKHVTRATKASNSTHSEPTLDRIPAMRGGSRKVGLARRLNAWSQNDS